MSKTIVILSEADALILLLVNKGISAMSSGLSSVKIAVRDPLLRVFEHNSWEANRKERHDVKLQNDMLVVTIERHIDI